MKIEEKNLIGKKLIILRELLGLSQRELSNLLQVNGISLDKNTITRIETSKRYVRDYEVKALALFFNVSYEFLLNEEEENKIL